MPSGFKNLHGSPGRKGEHMGLILAAFLIERNFFGIDLLAGLDIGNRHNGVGKIAIIYN